MHSHKYWCNDPTMPADGNTCTLSTFSGQLARLLWVPFNVFDEIENTILKWVTILFYKETHIWFVLEFMLKNSTKIKFIGFILQLIQVKVHNFSTLLSQESVQSLSILWLRETHISRDVSSSRINNCSACFGHGLDQIVNHLR